MTRKAWDQPERKITSLDDDKLWAGFKWEETDKILSGEIQPKTMEEPERKIRWRIGRKRKKEETAMEEAERKIRRRMRRKREKEETAMEEPERKIPRKIASLDDDELWAGFKWEETDKILSGEIQPKTLITTYMFPCSKSYPERGPFIAREMASVFPNSKYVIRGPNVRHDAVIALAREKGCTSLIFAFTDHTGEDSISIVNLLNHAKADFRVIDLIPREDIPNRSDPISGLYPRLQMRGFKSPANVGTAKMIQALFPYVPDVPSQRSIAWFEKQNNYIFFRHSGYFKKETVEGQPPPSVRSLIKECGPRFALQFTGVHMFDNHTFEFYPICTTIWP
ncbi:unnamed protein product [Eruca vesicaria subsp. sativa]|uniref:Brix domain-containing protein n=1 Tax=Eruca vesicaria subsp. sativa TaxID=29727 RepID=A0ABC8LXC0_ERUVS|nr:unnamed protein product [Eruca vesicaria subsp. sativa]